MAGPYQPESPTTYPVGVYQLQTTDPVQGGLGGVANQPLLDLANRTAWLYQQLNSVLNGTVIPPTVAPLNSPTFTGSPKAPTAPLGDNSTLISTTAFVQATVGGQVVLNVAGGANVSLSAVQAGYGVLSFIGALTANISVIVPNVGAKWTIYNATTGPYTLTVKTAAGSGVQVTQGRRSSVICDTQSVYAQQDDFISPVLTGNPTAPTPATGDNSASISTTAFVKNQNYQTALGFVPVQQSGGAGQLANKVYIGWSNTNLKAQVDTLDLGNFVFEGSSPAFSGTPTAPTPAQFDASTKIATMAALQRALGNTAGTTSITATGTIGATNVGKTVNVACGSTGQTVSLPAAAAVPAGGCFVLMNQGLPYTLARSGSDIVSAEGTNSASYPIAAGAMVVAVSDGSGRWVLGGPGVLGASSDFARSLGGGGYQKLPGGFIIQWTSATVTHNVSRVPINLPIAFPNGGILCTATIGSSISTGTVDRSVGADVSGSTIYCTVQSTISGSSGVFFIAIGY